MLSTRILSLLVLVSVTVAPLAAWQTQQTTPPTHHTDPNAPLTNHDIINLVANHAAATVIVNHIKAHRTSFDLGQSGLLSLVKAGVPGKIIEAMQAAAANQLADPAPAPAPTPMVATAQQPNQPNSPSTPAQPAGADPAVFLVKGSSKQPLPGEATRLAHVRAKGQSFVDLAKDQLIFDAINDAINELNKLVATIPSTPGRDLAGSGVISLQKFGSARAPQSAPQEKQMYIWALKGASSPTNLTGSSLNFEVSYAGIPGVDVNSFEPVIIRLSVAQANPPAHDVDRLVGATEAAANARESTQPDWPVYSAFMENHVEAKVKLLDPGRAQIVPKKALTAGQYAVVFRPKDKSHKFAGEDVGTNQGEGKLFNYAWAFAVN
jgi:hypothetical protein